MGYFFFVNSSFLSVIILCLIFGVQITLQSEGDGHYMNEWAVVLRGGLENAHQVAQRHGMEVVAPIGSLPDHYLFRHSRIVRRSVDPATNHHQVLSQDADVTWTEQQRTKKRVKRGMLDTALPNNFKDPLWSKQWYLHGGGIGNSDMRVREAWAQGITGKGVVVTILDDGIEHTHPDLKQNYDPRASTDINSHDDDPIPRYDPMDENKHGTRCAGEVSAVANNSYCVVGVAYDSKIGGVRMLDGDVNDAVEAASLSLNPDHIDIYSASWGPDDNGQVVDGPGKLARVAFENGVKDGRQGRGSIFVWASGNGGRDKDSCSCDGYTNSVYTLSVSSASENGRKPWYLEECASTIATTFSSGGDREKQIISTDLHGRCTTQHTGTSASAPLAAGLCALALEANGNLTWRDMQHLVVLTSNPVPLLTGARDWITNAAGRKVSHVFGFGLMDAGRMVEEAKHWTLVPEQQIFIGHYDQSVRNIPGGGGLAVDIVVDTKGQINYLEHVQAEVTLTFRPRGALIIYLTSPSGTKSTLLPLRPRDQSSKLMAWRFLTVHCWGEDPLGKWTLNVANDGRVGNGGVLTSWRLILYGTKEKPTSGLANDGKMHILEPLSTVEDPHNIEPRDPAPTSLSHTATSGAASLHKLSQTGPSCHIQCRDNRCHDNTASGCYVCKNFRLDDHGPCVGNCGVNHFVREETAENGVRLATCLPCHYSCKSCSGPSENDCLDCTAHNFLDQYNSCLPCAAPCHNCSGSPTMCTSCVDEFYLDDSDCFSRTATTCPPGRYLDLSTSGASLLGVGPGQCLSCHSTCATCTGPSANDCIKCSPSLLLQNRTVCVPLCDTGFYVSNGHCLPCSQKPVPCISCRGPDPTDCTRCPDGWRVDATSGCVELDCGTKQFLDDVQGICSPCHSSCLTCNGPQLVDCLTCPDGAFLRKGKCVQKCPQSTYVDESNQFCKECPPSCLTCAWPGRDADCTSCHKGHTLTGSPSRGLCVPGECGIGYYQSLPKTEGCQACDSSCLTCKGPGPGNCVKCHPGGYALHRPTSKCVPCCIPGSTEKDACCVCRNQTKDKALRRKPRPSYRHVHHISPRGLRSPNTTPFHTYRYTRISTSHCEKLMVKKSVFRKWLRHLLRNFGLRVKIRGAPRRPTYLVH